MFSTRKGRKKNERGADQQAVAADGALRATKRHGVGQTRHSLSARGERMPKDLRAKQRADAKKAGHAAARGWSSTAPREELLRFAGYEFHYGMTLEHMRSQGLHVPASRDPDFSWGFFKQAKGRVHHALHQTAIASRNRAVASARIGLFERLDRTMKEASERSETATTEEQFQAIGLLCREALITLAQAVYNPQRHPTTDGVEPSETDVKRMLDAFLASELDGPDHRSARAHARSAVDMAVQLQHPLSA